ncbi:histidine kinase dimerization/phospho-acceptor domain-containing protein [Aquincola sp. MAHUQ-54]|uniref:histidine kinase n=1 Tax=Aquincola agrisoli TaxID=3119538 RepID=A0AAW9QET9_9BURK
MKAEAMPKEAPRTLLRHLLAWTLGALALVWASFIVVGFTTGVHEADELTDGHLASVAALQAALRDGRFDPQHALDAAQAVGPALKSHDYQQSMSVVVWDGEGRLLTRTGGAPLPAFDRETGFADLWLGDPPAAWRTFSRWAGPAQDRKIMVMLSIEERDDLAWDIALQVASPGLWVLPVIALALGLAIRRGLKPLHDLSQDVLSLDVHRPQPLSRQHPHAEFKVVVDSINTLVARQHAALTRERQLASEFAHELRTPLASIALHARSLQGPLDEGARRASLERLEHDAVRAGQVVQQLLALARASRAEMAEAAQPVDLDSLGRAVVAEYAQAALDSGHELALDSAGPFPLPGHPLLLELALRNLIDNALAHTPRGALVEVQLDARARWLQVCDSGGAPAEGGAGARHAGPSLGLGLGHRVVAKVAALHGATFGPAPPPPGFATCYRLTFPS